LDLIDEVNDSIDEVIKDQLTNDLLRVKDKTFETIKSYQQLLDVPGFNSDTLQQSPTFRSFILSSFEQYTKLFDFNEIKIPLSPGLPTVSEIVKFKFSNLKAMYPDVDCMKEVRLQKPRFRKITLDFFSKVNRKLDSFFNEE
jgi:hypothetical protein